MRPKALAANDDENVHQDQEGRASRTPLTAPWRARLDVMSRGFAPGPLAQTKASQTELASPERTRRAWSFRTLADKPPVPPGEGEHLVRAGSADKGLT